MAVKTDIEIAREAQKKPILEIGASWGSAETSAALWP